MEDNNSESATEQSIDDEYFASLTKSQAREIAFANTLACEPPSCPECNKKAADRNVIKCTYCGFYYGYLEKIFPKDLPTLDRLNDFSKQLTNSEKKSLGKSLKKLRKKYPQVVVKLVTLPLQADIQIQQMALWMLNECPQPDHEDDADRLWTILLLIDTNSKTSCYANGYKIEVFWTHDTCADSITSINYNLRKKSVYETLKESLEVIFVNLDHSKKMVRKQYRKFKNKIY